VGNNRANPLKGTETTMNTTETESIQHQEQIAALPFVED